MSDQPLTERLIREAYAQLMTEVYHAFAAYAAAIRADELEKAVGEHSDACRGVVCATCFNAVAAARRDGISAGTIPKDSGATREDGEPK